MTNYEQTWEGFEQSVQDITGTNLKLLAFYMSHCTDTELMSLLFDYINDLIGEDCDFSGQKAITYLTLIYFIRRELKERGTTLKFEGVEV